MRVHICGVRGSTPAPGPEFVRYGGNTSCVAVAVGDELPSLVLDAGTGLGRLSALFDGRPFRGVILLGHLHWDHTHGLPFFPAGLDPDAEVEVYLPEQGVGAAELLARVMSPPHFPISPDQLPGAWSFATLDEGEHRLAGFSILARQIPHGTGRSLGYRVSRGGASLAYVTDHNPVRAGPGPDGLGELHEAVLELADGVDLLLHDAQHTAAEYPAKSYLGHATAEYAMALAEAAGARRLLLFHHDYARTDDEIDAIAAALGVEAASEGMVIDL